MPAASAVLLTRGNALIVEPIRPDIPSLAGDAAEEGSSCELRELDPGLDSGDGVGGVRGGAADQDLAPAGLAAQRHQQAFVEQFDPAAAVFGLIAAEVQAGDLRAAQGPSETDQQHRAALGFATEEGSGAGSAAECDATALVARTFNTPSRRTRSRLESPPSQASPRSNRSRVELVCETGGCGRVPNRQRFTFIPRR